MNFKILFLILFSLIFLMSNVFADYANCDLSISNQLVGLGEDSEIEVVCDSDVVLDIEIISDVGGFCEYETGLEAQTGCAGTPGFWNCNNYVFSPTNLVNFASCFDEDALRPRGICFEADIFNAETSELIDSIGGDCSYGFGDDMFVYEVPRIELESVSSKTTGSQFNFSVDAAFFWDFSSADAIEIDPDCDLIGGPGGTQCDFSQFPLSPAISINGFDIPAYEIENYIIPFTYTNESCVGGTCFVALKVTDSQGNERFAQIDGGVFVIDSGITCLAGTACITSQSCSGICALDNFTCIDVPDDNCPVIPGGCEDDDNDNFFAAYCGGSDCNDNNPNVNPGVIEVCGNGIDDNCNNQWDETCPPIEICSDPCNVIVNGVSCPGSCVNNVCLDVVDNCPTLPSGPNPSVDGSSCIAIVDGFSVPGIIENGECIDVISDDEPNSQLISCSQAELGEYQCSGNALLQCQNSSSFNWASVFSFVNEVFEWRLVESCEAACIDSGSADFCEMTLAFNDGCVDSSTYTFGNGASCKDKNDEYFDRCDGNEAKKVKKYVCNEQKTKCINSTETCSSGKICENNFPESDSCEKPTCWAIEGPNNLLVCGWQNKGLIVDKIKAVTGVIDICTEPAMELITEIVFEDRRVADNVIFNDKFDDGMEILFPIVRNLHGVTFESGVTISECKDGINYNLSDFLNKKVDGKCIFWSGVMFSLARTMGVPEDRLEVASFSVEATVRVYSPSLGHANLFYESDSGDWWVFDITSGCAGIYKSLEEWHDVCGQANNDCSLTSLPNNSTSCTDFKMDDYGYSTFLPTDIGGACSEVTTCENNVCANGVKLGVCVPNSKPYYCSDKGNVPSVTNCNCPTGSVTGPYNITCACRFSDVTLSNGALCTNEEIGKDEDGRTLYYLSYDCSGIDHKVDESDNASCGAGFYCKPNSKNEYPYATCQRIDRLI